MPSGCYLFNEQSKGQRSKAHKVIRKKGISVGKGGVRQNNSCLPLIAAKDKGEKKLFGFAFSPLMRDDGTTLSDDIHELYVYKVRSLGLSPAQTTLTCGSRSGGSPEWARGSRVGCRWRQQGTCGQAFVFSHRSHQQGLCFQLLTPLVVEIYYSAPLCHYSLGSYIWRPAI